MQMQRWVFFQIQDQDMYSTFYTTGWLYNDVITVMMKKEEGMSEDENMSMCEEDVVDSKELDFQD